MNKEIISKVSKYPENLPPHDKWIIISFSERFNGNSTMRVKAFFPAVEEPKKYIKDYFFLKCLNAEADRLVEFDNYKYQKGFVWIDLEEIYDNLSNILTIVEKQNRSQ